jgi:propanol-preferring alcohol dehydrogenase
MNELRRSATGRTMRAMVLESPRTPLREAALPLPEPGPGQVRVRVRACAVCRTDLHVVDGELAGAKLPLVPGHEIAGEVDALGADATRFEPGQRVGVPWLGWTCGECAYCLSDRENLCERARFTGYTLDGGYADYALADERFCFALPAAFGDVAAAPLMCAGLIGYRSLVKAGDAQRLGIYGFGAAAHLVAQVARWQGREVYAFTRPGDAAAQRFARGLGATWTGGSDERPPELRGHYGTSTAAPCNRPSRSRASASFACSSGNVSVSVRTGICAASARNSSPSWRVRLATERTVRSCHRSS